MKRTISILAFAFLLFSCGEESYWNEDRKTGFLDGCESGNTKRIEQAGVNPFEQMGTTVEEICDCMLTKTMEEFPNGSEDKTIMLKSGTKTAEACLADLKK